MSTVRRHLFREEVGHFLPVISPKQCYDQVSLMEARVPLRNVTNQYPSGSLTPSRPSATKHMTRRAHSAGKLRKEVSISFEPQSHSNDDYVGYSPLSVSDFCVSPPSHKKRPMFGRTVIISRSENSHMNKTVGTTDMEPRRHLYKPTRPQALESDKIKKNTSDASPISPRRVGFSCDTSPSHWYPSKAHMSPGVVHEARNLFDQFELDGEVDNQFEGDVDDISNSEVTTSRDQDTLESKTEEETPSFTMSAELTVLVSSELEEEAVREPEYQWEFLVKSVAPFNQSFVPTLETVSESCVLDFVFKDLLSNTCTSQASTDEQMDTSSSDSIKLTKKSKRKSAKSSPSRRSDTYGAWMQKQVGCSNQFMHVFRALEQRHFDKVENELKLLEEEDETLLVIDCPRDDFNNTLLMAACHSGSKKAVRWCLAQGADVDIQNKYDNTALHFAMEFGLNKIAAHLQDKQNANVHLVNHLRLTCFQRAATNENASSDDP